MIVLILLGTLVILGVTIGLLVHFLAFEKTHYYQVSFKVADAPHDYDCEKIASPGSRDLIKNIEILISNAFYNSPISKEYILSQLIRLSSEINGATAKILLVFKSNLKKKNNIQRSLRSILHQMLKENKKSLFMDPSSLKFFEISKEDAKNLTINCCGRQLSPISDDLITGNNRIMGGVPSKEGEWPWQASLKWNGRHWCGASLISKRWLVSAAHCFIRFIGIKNWTVTFGNTLNHPHMTRNIKEIILHKDYQSRLQYDDIALVQLTKEVTFTKNVRTICLPDPTQNYTAGDRAIVTGWGKLSINGPYPKKLQQATVKIIDRDTCNAPQAYHGLVTDSMLCAGYMSGKVDSCEADSGGPLVSFDHIGSWYLTGVVSWGEGCGKVNKPGVYTKVASYLDWIANKTGI
ncbi:transmembrane protease serine 11B-like [Gracilinanus agilis]|uniref:transmembrane protease serine 11B-like n=1 Tax=Gracilinanus agilis TaxID=191870 RepID=UPI001CFD0632|nr:transmembrane protease serine 11B-like [Gracilinanus agilis]